MLKTLKIAAVTLLLQLVMVFPAVAQTGVSGLAGAASTNQELLNQIDSALAATDLATLQARTRTVVATGQALETTLQGLVASAPDDATRSRAQGLLNHITAAVQSGQAVLSATSLDAARSSANAARGEINEALAEFPVAQLPSAGEEGSGIGIDGTTSLILALGGGLTLLAGLGLRRRTAW